MRQEIDMHTSSGLIYQKFLMVNELDEEWAERVILRAEGSIDFPGFLEAGRCEVTGSVGIFLYCTDEDHATRSGEVYQKVFSLTSRA